MLHEFSREEMIIGKEALERLTASKVAVYGVGGVGSFVVEGLARAGIGKFVLVDDDLVCIRNINRQLLATHKTIGRPKVEVMKERILDINPKAEVLALKRFYLPDTANEIIQGDEEYFVDAIDTVTAKLDLIVRAGQLGIPIISAMGTGNKLDPTRFEVTDIYKTSMDPLSKVMRRELKKRGIPSLKVVYSKEEPMKPLTTEESVHVNDGDPAQASRKSARRQIPGSISFVPSVAGLIIAGEVIKDLIKKA